MANEFKNSITGSAGPDGLIPYTTPVSTVATIIGLNVSNVVYDNIYIDVTVTDASRSITNFLIKNALVLPGSNLVLVGGDQKIVLEASDYIEVTSTVSDSADIILSVLEIA